MNGKASVCGVALFVSLQEIACILKVGLCYSTLFSFKLMALVLGSSVRPKFRVTRNGAVINENSTTESLDHCLYNGDFTFYEEIVIGVEETFECVVSYGERDESREIRFTCIGEYLLL